MRLLLEKMHRRSTSFSSSNLKKWLLNSVMQIERILIWISSRVDADSLRCVIYISKLSYTCSKWNWPKQKNLQKTGYWPPLCNSPVQNTPS